MLCHVLNPIRLPLTWYSMSNSCKISNFQNVSPKILINQPCWKQIMNLQGGPAKVKPTYIFDCNIWMHRWNSIIFSERELMFMFAICRRPSVCRLSVTFVHPNLRLLKFSAMFLRHLIRWWPDHIQVKFYGDRPRGTPPSGG